MNNADNVQVYFDSQNSLEDIQVKTINNFNVLNQRCIELDKKINRALFSIDMVIKSVNNYIKADNEFQQWYYEQSFFRKFIWRIKHKTIQEIKDIYKQQTKNSID